MSAHVEQASVLSGRSLALLVSFAVPMLFFYGLARNIGVIDFLPDPPMQASFPDETKQPTPTVEKVVPLLPLEGERTKVVIERPNIPFLTEEPVAARSEETPVGGGPAAGGGTAVAPIPATPLNHIALRPSDDFYPPISIRMAEQGSTEIKVCVSAAGSLQGMPAVTASSGHKRLDAAAVTWAREALRFEPATENGAAVAACKGFRVNFRLH